MYSWSSMHTVYLQSELKNVFKWSVVKHFTLMYMYFTKDDSVIRHYHIDWDKSCCKQQICMRFKKLCRRFLLTFSLKICTCAYTLTLCFCTHIIPTYSSVTAFICCHRKNDSRNRNTYKLSIIHICILYVFVCILIVVHMKKKRFNTLLKFVGRMKMRKNIK